MVIARHRWCFATTATVASYSDVRSSCGLPVRGVVSQRRNVTCNNHGGLRHQSFRHNRCFGCAVTIFDTPNIHRHHGDRRRDYAVLTTDSLTHATCSSPPRVSCSSRRSQPVRCVCRYGNGCRRRYTSRCHWSCRDRNGFHHATFSSFFHRSLCCQSPSLPQLVLGSYVVCVRVDASAVGQKYDHVP